MKNNLQPKLTPVLLWIMTISSGLVVANNYYNQPMLGIIANEFGVSESVVSNITVFTQIGYALGLFFFIPLGDMLNRKKMILIDFVVIILSLLAMAISPSIYLLFPISLVIGFSCVIPQLFVPMAASLAAPEDKAKAVGFVTSGLLVGILGSRVLSGYIGSWLGWREMYLIAAGLMSVLFILLYIKLPEVSSVFKGRYKELMISLVKLFKEDPILRITGLRGAFSFAALNCLWSPLVFHLKDDFHLTDAIASTTAGNLGLIGMGGAIAAVLVGKVPNKYDKNNLISIAYFLCTLAWIFLAWDSSKYLGLIAGIILIDIGVQAGTILNQSSIFALYPNATNRVNTIYMTSYFIGGSLGTLLASHIIEVYHWQGVSILGGIFAFSAFLVQLLFSKK